MLTDGSGLIVYIAPMAGIIQLTTVAASQYMSLGIRINCIAPPFVDTFQARGSTQSTEAIEGAAHRRPIRRTGLPEEIANTILFLASDESSYMSGSTLIVNGGSWTGAFRESSLWKTRKS